MCLESNTTLNTNKTLFGFPSVQFFGFTADKEGTHLSDKHLDPIASLVPPTNIPELRRVLGLYIVSRKCIRDYAMITAPMTSILRGRNPEFSWGPARQSAFGTVRELLLGGIHLAAPDYEIPFHLATDASEDGKGGMLYQLPSVPLNQQFPYSPRTHAAVSLSVIQFLSKAWNDAARNRPPFCLEADALSSKFPLCTCSDHLPLAWMSKSTKGPVSQFLIETLSELDTVHQRIPGPANSIPDAASRHPVLGPKRLAPLGLENSVQEALRRIPAELKTAVITHVHAGQDTGVAGGQPPRLSDHRPFIGES